MLVPVLSYFFTFSLKISIQVLVLFLFPHYEYYWFEDFLCIKDVIWILDYSDLDDFLLLLYSLVVSLLILYVGKVFGDSGGIFNQKMKEILCYDQGLNGHFTFYLVIFIFNLSFDNFYFLSFVYQTCQWLFFFSFPFLPFHQNSFCVPNGPLRHQSDNK